MPSHRATHEHAGIAANTDVKAKAEIGSYEDAAEFLDGATSKKLASNVVVKDLPGRIGIFLYATEIISYYSDETFTVRNGGYNTPTTSRRVTQFTPDGYVFFHQDKHLTVNNKRGSIEEIKLPVEKE